MRPFDFLVPVWGRRYSQYFVDRFLPSMLAPKNLPLFDAVDGHRILIATTREDRRFIENLPIMKRVRQHVLPTWIEIDPPESCSVEFDQYAANLRHMSLCLRKLVECAHPVRSYGCSLLPDLILSDGFGEALLKYARTGYQLVLSSSLRQTEEGILEELRKLGLWSSEQRSLTGEALVLPARVAAGLAVRHLHPELAMFEEGAAGQPSLPPFRYWRVPEEGGIILHTFYAVPVLIDFAIVPPNHTSCLDNGHFENVYIGSNFHNCKAYHVRDSDEFFILSLAPAAVNYAPPRANAEPQRRYTWARDYDRLCSIRRSMEFYARSNLDTVKRDLFRTAFRWHGRNLDNLWMKEERRIDRIIACAVGDYFAYSSDKMRRFPRRISRNPRYLPLDWPVLWLSCRYPRAVFSKVRNIVGSLQIFSRK